MEAPYIIGQIHDWEEDPSRWYGGGVTWKDDMGRDMYRPHWTEYLHLASHFSDLDEARQFAEDLTDAAQMKGYPLVYRVYSNAQIGKPKKLHRHSIW